MHRVAQEGRRRQVAFREQLTGGRPRRGRPCSIPGRPGDQIGRWHPALAASMFDTSRNGTDPRVASVWTRRQVAENNARALVGRAFPRVRGMVREPSWVFFEILLPFLTTSAFVLVYRTLQAPEAYVGFVVLGGAMAAFWLNVVWMMAAQLYWEKDQGNLELYFAAPMNLMSVLLGMAVGGLIMSSTRAARDPGGVHLGVRRHVRRPAVGPAARGVLPDAVGAVRPGDGDGQPVPPVGPRGVPHDQRDDRARVLRVRDSTSRSAGWARWARSRSPRSRSPSASTRCASWCSRGSRTSPARRRPRWRR